MHSIFLLLRWCRWWWCQSSLYITHTIGHFCELLALPPVTIISYYLLLFLNEIVIIYDILLFILVANVITVQTKNNTSHTVIIIQKQQHEISSPRAFVHALDIITLHTTRRRRWKDVGRWPRNGGTIQEGVLETAITHLVVSQSTTLYHRIAFNSQ